MLKSLVFDNFQAFSGKVADLCTFILFGHPLKIRNDPDIIVFDQIYNGLYSLDFLGVIKSGDNSVKGFHCRSSSCQDLVLR